MDLNDELEATAEIARTYAADGEELAAVIPAEPAQGVRVYLCAFEVRDGRSWLALYADGQPVANRSLLRDAVSIAALCELADELSGAPDDVEPRVASPAYLDAVAAAATPSLAETLKQGTLAVEGLMAEVESTHKVELH
ncbi:MAG: hypothetical protein ACRDLU_03775 [Gaiellaceae bacterium]